MMPAFSFNTITGWISQCNIAKPLVRLPWPFDRCKSSLLCGMQLSMIPVILVNTPHYIPLFCSKLVCQVPFPCCARVISRLKVEPDKIKMNNTMYRSMIKWPETSLDICYNVLLNLKTFTGSSWGINSSTNFYKPPNKYLTYEWLTVSLAPLSS